MLVVAISLQTSCTDQIVEQRGDEKVSGNLLLRLSISRRDMTRSGKPQGGEDGDGRENGQHHENDIDKVILFCYTSAAGINAPDDTPVERLAVVQDVNFHPVEMSGSISTEILVKAYQYRPRPNDQFVVVTNCDNFQATTLGQLRNHIVLQTFLPSNSGGKDNYKLFVMSNEGNSTMVTHEGTEDDPHIVTIDIERMAARIDFCVDGSTVDGESLNFEASDKNTVVGNVLVSHARVLNGMKNPSYLIKRDAESATSPISYLADEVTPTTRYVCEPTTWSKTSATDDNLLAWFGESRHALANVQQHAWFSDKDKVHTATTGDGFNTGTTHDTQNNLHYYVLDYVNENTMTPTGTTGRTATAIALNAIYQPKEVYKLDAEDNLVEDTEYSRGKTFWRCRAIVREYDETQSPCFSSLAAAEAYKASHPEIVSEIEKYTDARCYYIVYLRHDNSPDSPYITPMEFGIVRNNIYRLKVGFTGPGYAQIPEETDINPEGIRPYIFVRKWYKIVHPEIVI